MGSMIHRLPVASAKSYSTIRLRWSLLAATFLLAACATPRPLLERAPSPVLQWPERPAAARIEWVKSIAIPEDAGIAKGFWKKALELVTGADQRRIVKPYGVLYDAAGRLMIADPGAGLVHIMDTKAGLYSVIVSSSGAPLRSPIGLAEDQDNGLYITDSVTDTVYRYDLLSHALTPFLRAIDRPTGIAYNRVNKLLYVSETGANEVLAVDLKGNNKIRFSNVSTPAGYRFNHPTDVAVDLKGQVYVTDPLNYKIRIFTPEGIPVTQFGEMGDARGELSKPKGIAVDSQGRIYLCDAMLDMVKVFEDSGRLLFSFGANGAEPGAFWMPSGIFVRGEFIFVADTYNQRIQIFRILNEGEGRPDDDAKTDRPRSTTRLN
jgi:sugar lactone lactonase YvrE